MTLITIKFTECRIQFRVAPKWSPLGDINHKSYGNLSTNHTLTEHR